MQVEKIARDLFRYAKKIFSPEVLTVAGNGLVAAGEGLIKAGKHMRELCELLKKNNLGELWSNAGDSGKTNHRAPPGAYRATGPFEGNPPAGKNPKPAHNDDDLPF